MAPQLGLNRWIVMRLDQRQRVGMTTCNAQVIGKQGDRVLQVSSPVFRHRVALVSITVGLANLYPQIVAILGRTERPPHVRHHSFSVECCGTDVTPRERQVDVGRNQTEIRVACRLHQFVASGQSHRTTLKRCRGIRQTDFLNAQLNSRKDQPTTRSSHQALIERWPKSPALNIRCPPAALVHARSSYGSKDLTFLQPIARRIDALARHQSINVESNAVQYQPMEAKCDPLNALRPGAA